MLNWIEDNALDYLLLPPSNRHPPGFIDKEWSIYYSGHVFVTRGNTLRECIIQAKEWSIIYADRIAGKDIVEDEFGQRTFREK